MKGRNSFFKTPLFIVCVLSSVSLIAQTTRFKLCEAMLADKNNESISLSLFFDGDTILLNNYDFDQNLIRRDNKTVTFLLENLKFIYEFDINSDALECKELKLCFTKDRHKGKYGYYYYYCRKPVSVFGYAKRYRKKCR